VRSRLPTALAFYDQNRLKPGKSIISFPVV